MYTKEGAVNALIQVRIKITEAALRWVWVKQDHMSDLSVRLRALYNKIEKLEIEEEQK